MGILVLWDVDETLIHVGAIHRRVWLDVCSQLTGRTASSVGSLPGRTAPQVLLDGLALVGLGEAEALALLPEATRLEELGLRSRRGEMHAHGHVSPGAEALLGALNEIDGVVQAPLTGNTRANTVLKLDIFGLAAHFNFDVGAYGSDDRFRPNLGALAQRRAHEILGMSPVETMTVVVGDSPLDVETGKRINARVVAVALGVTDPAALAAAGADVVLDGLANTEAAVGAILGHRALRTSASD